MKVKYLIEILQRCNPEAEVWADDYSGESSDHTHGPTKVWQETRDMYKRGRIDVVRIDRGKDGITREQYRKERLQTGDGGIQSPIQHYRHLRASTEEESAADLAAGAIDIVENIEDISRIRRQAEDKQAAVERRDRAELERLKALYT